MKRYIIVDTETDEFIAVDKSSGNYPYSVSHWDRADHWGAVENAAQYIAVCKWNDPDHTWVLKEIEVSFKDLSDQDEQFIKDLWASRNGPKIPSAERR